MSSQQYISDENGKREAIILPISEYEKMLGIIGKLETIKEYDEAKASGLSFKPLNTVIEDVEKYPTMPISKHRPLLKTMLDFGYNVRLFYF